MATLKEYRQEQLEKVEALRVLGVNPYPAKSFRDASVQSIIEEQENRMGKGACIAGRLLSRREHGKVQFLDIEDGGATIQVIAREENLQAEYPKGLLGFENLGLLTRGDVVEVAGVVANSQTGQLSIEARGVRVLTKVLRPLPTSLEDKETRLRRRYLDMAINTDVRDRFTRRSKFWQATRNFLDSEGFTEINIPVLEHTTGGADANPFVTHMDALGEDFYLRISHELPLKRLIGAGFEKVYDLGPRFRNENYSDEHLPEHIAFESYAAYQDYNDGIELYERMMKQVAMETWGTYKFKVGDFEIDISGDWPRRTYAEVLSERFAIDVFNPDLEQLKAVLKDNNVEFDDNININRAMDSVWKIIRRESTGPFWLIHEPVEISPLAKQDPDDPQVTQRFHPVIAGSELGNGYSELNDPVDQLDRFIKQQQMRDAGDDEAQMLDIDFVEMLEYGMPPACGWSYSERFFWMFEGVTAREGVVFPQLRREVEESTKDAYPEIYGADGLMANAGNRKQDESKRLVAVVNKELEPWQVANTASHMSAYHANKMAKDEFDSGEYFITKDSHQLPRNAQFPIMIKKAEHKDLHKLYKKAKEAGLKVHVFIKEMIDTSIDAEIVEALKDQAMEDVNIYGIALYGDNEAVNTLTKSFRLWN